MILRQLLAQRLGEEILLSVIRKVLAAVAQLQGEAGRRVDARAAVHVFSAQVRKFTRLSREVWPTTLNTAWSCTCAFWILAATSLGSMPSIFWVLSVLTLICV